MADEWVDFHSLNYVSTVDNNLCCPVCRSPLVEPVYTSCRHTFCSTCINKALERSETCPIDRTPLTQQDVQPAPIMIANIVNELVVFCPNSDAGCTFTCARYLIEGHLSHDCGYVWVNCRGCEEKVMRKDVDKDCLHQLAECSGCFEQFRKIDLEEHDKECPGLVVVCDFCESEFQRSAIREHIAVCDEATISCDASKYGCPWTGRRKDASDHMSTCPFSFLRPVLQAHADRLTKLELENYALRKRIDFLQPRSPSESPERAILDEQVYMILSDQERLRLELENLSSNVLRDLDMKHQVALMNETGIIKEELAAMRAALQALRMQLHWLMTLRSHGDFRPMGVGLNGMTSGGLLPRRDGPGPSHVGNEASVRRQSGGESERVKL